MKCAKVLRFLFILVLALGVFGGELVEVSRLADDVSNDFVQVSATPIHKCAQLAFGYWTPQKSIPVAEEVVNPAIIPYTEPAPYSASDLLRLLSVQRK